MRVSIETKLKQKRLENILIEVADRADEILRQQTDELPARP